MMKLEERNFESVINKVINGDCIRILRSFPKKLIEFVFADPPYNIGIKYDLHDDNMPRDQYLKWSKEWIGLIYDILKDSGSFYLAIGDEYAAELNIIAKEIGFYQRNWIIWHYTFGQNQRKKFSRAHTHIFYFTKDKDEFTFNTDAIRIPSERQATYNDKRAHPKGKVPDDVWRFSRVCGTFKERINGYPCQMPEALLERVIRVSSNEGDIILDPFAGSGTTLAVAKRLNRRYIGIEISQKYCNIIEKRLSKGKIQTIINGFNSS